MNVFDEQLASSQTTVIEVTQTQLQQLDGHLPPMVPVLMDRVYNIKWM